MNDQTTITSLDYKHWFTITNSTKSRWKKDQVVGGFMIYGVGDRNLIATIQYKGRPHTHWGHPHYYADSINYRWEVARPAPILANKRK